MEKARTSRPNKNTRPINDIRGTSSYLEYLGLSRVDKRGESRRGGSGEGRREGGKGAETRRGGGGEERRPSVMRRPRGQGRPRERGDEKSKESEARRRRKAEGEEKPYTGDEEANVPEVRETTCPQSGSITQRAAPASATGRREQWLTVDETM